MAIGRRGFMAALGIGAAAGPQAAKMLARNAPQSFGGGIGGIEAMGSTMGYANSAKVVTQAVAPWTQRGITEAIWNLWNAEANEAQEALNRYTQMNVQGHDPVVFACKSWSPAFGVSYTYRKLKAMEARTSTLRERLWK